MTEGAPVEDDLRARSITELLEQIARRNSLIEQLRAQIGEMRDNRDAFEQRAVASAELVAGAERDLAAARAELAAVKQRLERIEASPAYRRLESYRVTVRRFAPPGTFRNKVYRAATWPLRRMGRKKRAR